MEQQQINAKKKKDKKPIYILFGFLLFFCFFVFLLTRPSTQSKAIRELETCINKKDVEIVWYKYKSDLFQDEDFLNEIRTKLTSYNLNDYELKECRSWLPPSQTSINVIVIPDLSRRITDTLNNPNQIDNDKFVLKTIWKAFVGYSKLKQDTKDRLIIDVTDIDQAKGQFGTIANNLQFDLSNHKDKSNRLYFTEVKNTMFTKSIDALYNSAKEKPLGADYRLYFKRYLSEHLQKPTLFDNYINKVIIITDGYLEAENKPADTKIKGYQSQLYKSVDSGNTKDVITTLRLNIPKVDIDLSNTDVLVCEVNERRFVPFTKIPNQGKGRDFEILRAYWEDWINRMGRKKLVFTAREKANEMTAKKINEFISK